MERIIDTLRRGPIGRRHKINRREMQALLHQVHLQRQVDLDNGWHGAPAGASIAEIADRWAAACTGINVISLLAPEHPRLGSNPGDIRYDAPGSMHPMMRAEVMFAAAGMEAHTYDYLRRRTRRLLIVTGD